MEAVVFILGVTAVTVLVEKTNLRHIIGDVVLRVMGENPAWY